MDQERTCSDCGKPIGRKFGDQCARCVSNARKHGSQGPPADEVAAAIADIRREHGLREYSDAEERALRGLVNE